jgi:MoxR-like ATPase
MALTESVTGPPLPLEPAEFERTAQDIRDQVSRVIVGQAEAVTGVLTCLLTGKHALLEGVPGLGKTSLALAFSRAARLPHGRIQFTPDLMPADITGTTVLSKDPGGQPVIAFQPGPVFTGLLLADEVNRATPKTQSALLEAMEEGTVTVANVTRPLSRPFCVLATQNPIEAHGTYPLPEAQLDRFLLKLLFRLPSNAELGQIIMRTANSHSPAVSQVADAGQLTRMTALVRAVPIAPHVADYASRLTLALHPDLPGATEPVRRFVRYGPSPRGAQALCLAGRVVALRDGRFSLAYRDIRAVALPALRHRLVLNLAGQREGKLPDEIIETALARVPEEP